MAATVLIQARTGSTRLPGKVLAPLAGRPMLAVMLHRLHDLPAQIVVATSDLPRDDAVVELASTAGVASFRGSESDVLERMWSAAQQHPADTYVRLTADCPLMDPALVVAGLAHHAETEGRYTSNTLVRTYPVGLDLECIDHEVLREAAEMARTAGEREHVTPYIYRRPERFPLRVLRQGKWDERRRWTVDEPADLEHVRGLLDRAGDIDAGWQDLLALEGPTGDVADALRPAMADDVDRILTWRNDASSVANSPSGAVDPEAHAAWFRDRLDDAGHSIRMRVLDGDAVASVRIAVENAVGTVSVTVDPTRRGHGLGSSTLAMAVEDWKRGQQVDELIARIRNDNVASQRAFARAGFVRVEGGELERWAMSVR